MPSATLTFLQAMCRAAGLSMTQDGEIRAGKSVVYRVPVRADQTVTEECHLAALDWIRATQADDAALMRAYGETIRAEELGVLGLAVKTSPDLRRSLQLVERYFRLVTDTVIYRLEETATHASLVLEEITADHPAKQFRTECAFAGFARNIRCFAGPGVTFAEVTFRHRCRSDPDRYAGYFGCPVRFDAGRDALVMPRAALDLPNRIGDPAVSAYFVRHLEDDIGKLGAAGDLQRDVLHHVSQRLQQGVPQASDTARAMGMSERTLYRRLSDEGLTFREVVRQAQQELAFELLSASECSISEIAFLTGFSEQSTFTRAFKRWAGQAPAQYRLGAAHS